MNEIQSNSERPAEKVQKPIITKISRRKFAKAAGAILACGSAATLISRLTSKSKNSQHSNKPNRITLPPYPSHNPVFSGKTVSDGTIILFTNSDKQFNGYQLNRSGCSVWKLCDGKHSKDQIAEVYAKNSGRPRQEAQQFLRELEKLRIVVSGGYVITHGNFPKPAQGDCYHLLTKSDEVTQSTNEA